MPADTAASAASAADTIPDSAGQVVASIQHSLMQIWSDFLDRLPFIAAGLLVLMVTWGVAAIARRTVQRTLRDTAMRSSLKELLNRFAVMGVWILGVLLAAMVVFPGLTPTKALSAMGIASIAIGFAFKDIFENFFAGILLLWRFPFENGDFVECEDVMGAVEDISVRMTQVRHPSGELVVLPNSFLFKNPVRILTARNRRRVTLTAGIAYGANVPDAVAVITQAVKGCDSVSADHPVQVFPMAFGSSSIDIEVAWWSDPTPLGVRRSRGEVVAAIKRELDAAGIEIPFPYRTLTVHEPLRFTLVGAGIDGADPHGD
jgi:small-conductance mechanosensitive channel